MNDKKIVLNFDNQKNYKYFLLTFDDNYTNVAIGLIKSMIYNTKENLCFIIMSKSFNNDSIEKLKSLNLPMVIYYVNKDLFNYDEFKHSSWPIDSTFRLIAPWIIEEKMDYLYYLDADIICVNNMDDLFTLKFNESIAFCPELTANTFKMCEKFQTDYLYCNSGFLIYNMNKIKEKYTMDLILNSFNSMVDQLSFTDQDFINLFYLNDSKCLNPFKYNNQVYDFYNKHLLKTFLNNAIFVHFCVVKGKPWDKNSTLTRYNIYLKYSKDAYMCKVVSNARIIYILRAPFYKSINLFNRALKKIYKVAFRKNVRGGVKLPLNLKSELVLLFRLSHLKEVI